MLETRQTSLEGVCRPVASALGLPNQYYTDHSLYEFEKTKLFGANWTAIGFAKDVPAVGDANPIDFLGIPMLMVRDTTNRVRVFQNTCRHRGMILVETPINIRGVIRCPYHSWCYELNGQLRSTPHVGGPGVNNHPEIKPSDLGLSEFRSFVWRDVVFVNLSDMAPDFTVYAADLIARWSEFDQPIFHSGADSSFNLQVQGNWKLAVENYCESYHLPWVHPGLNSYSKLKDHYNIEQPGHYSGQGTWVYQPKMDGTGSRFVDFRGLGKKWNTAAEYIALYPNVLFGVHRDHVYAIVIVPKGPNRCIERVELYYASEEMCGDGWSELRATNTRMWKQIFVEDLGVVEGMQKGRSGPLFDGGKFSPVMDGPTHTFHRWVADQY